LDASRFENRNSSIVSCGARHSAVLTGMSPLPYAPGDSEPILENYWLLRIGKKKIIIIII